MSSNSSNGGVPSSTRLCCAHRRSQLHREPHRLRAVLLFDGCDHALAQPKKTQVDALLADLKMPNLQVADVSQ